MKRTCYLAAFFLILGTSVNAQSFFKSVYGYAYSNDTVYAEVVSSIRSFSDVCYKIKVLGFDITDIGNTKSLQLYYHTPQSTGGGIPMDCIVVDTIAIPSVTSSTSKIYLNMYTVAPITQTMGDTTDENSAAIIFLPLNVIKTTQYGNKLAMYPNPANNLIYLENVIAGTKFEIFDIVGTSVYSGEVFDSHHNININSLSPGVYVLRLGQPTGEHVTMRFLKK